METAYNLMTREVTVIPQTATVLQALRALKELEVRHLPVINEEHEVVGMLSDRDLTPLSDHPSKLLLPVSNIMSSNVITATPETDLEELIDLMAEQRIGAIPIVDPDRHLSGIVSYIDVLRAVPKALRDAEEGRSD